jgi:hypothetical protein
VAMKLKALASELRLIADRGGPFGSATEAGFRELADALELRGDDDLVALLKLLRPKPKKLTNTVTSVLDTPARDPIVMQFLSELSRKETANAAVGRMAKSGAVNKAQAEEIAVRFLNAPQKLTKKAALELIRQRVAKDGWDDAAIELIQNRGQVKPNKATP